MRVFSYLFQRNSMLKLANRDIEIVIVNIYIGCLIVQSYNKSINIIFDQRPWRYWSLSQFFEITSSAWVPNGRFSCNHFSWCVIQLTWTQNTTEECIFFFFREPERHTNKHWYRQNSAVSVSWFDSQQKRIKSICNA